MQFDNVREYIEQVYGKLLPADFVSKNVKSLTYLKLVRVLSKLKIEPHGSTAQQLFADALRLEYNQPNQSQWLFQLADLHEECERLIYESGVLYNERQYDGDYVDDINS